MPDILYMVIELAESPFPDNYKRRLDEEIVKNNGQIWKIYKNDQDPFPSNPHAHNEESRLKLDLSNGKLYCRRTDTGYKISEKNLRLIRDKIKGIPLPPLSL